MRSVDVLGPGGPIARAIEGYEHRDGQLRMAESVEVALAHDGVLLVEAGTGTGKTLAYLTAAILSGKKTIVSTATKTLQDQIVSRDVPLLERVFAPLGIEVRIAALKGLANYLCLRRYHEHVRSADADRHDDRSRNALSVIREWRESTFHGDRAELVDLDEDDAVWREVASSSETRIGSNCEHYEPCFVTRARREAEDAQIVIVNHHLFFADLATRNPTGASVLPDYESVILDEAHRVDEVCTEFFGARVSTSRVEALVRDAERAFRGAGIYDEGGSVIGAVLRLGAELFTLLPTSVAREGGRHLLAIESLAPDVLPVAHALDAALEALSEHAKRRAVIEPVLQIAKRASTLRDELGEILDRTRGGDIAWIEAHGRNTVIGKSPIDISAIFREHVAHRARGLVLTSATLATDTSFSFVRNRLGLDFELDESIVASPFAYETQALLYTPDGMPEPRSEDFGARAAAEVEWLVRETKGGAFVLSTSTRAMRDLARHLRAANTGLELLVQGDAPKHALLDRFRANGHAVLVATASFWEGVDVPGDALRLVVIDKLPFDVPTDPIVAARCAAIEERGGRPFVDYMLPAAVLTLKQGFGRLIRSRSDRGVVAVLDSRVQTKGYGAAFLRALPSAPRAMSRALVTEFLHRVGLV